MPLARDILVIKLGALGDFIQAIGPFQAIRRHHADDRLTLLTTAPFAPLAEMSGFFDDIWIDKRPRWHQLGAWFGLRRRLRRGHFTRVYDLQTSDRSSGYLKLWWPDPRPEWSGVAAGCSHPHRNPQRDFMHTIERQREQLADAGIDDDEPPDLSWFDADTGAFGLAERHALLAPGGAPHRPDKRWPADRFAAVAKELAARGIQPVIVGTEADRPAAMALSAQVPEARDLLNATSIPQLAGLARRAAIAIGNDTGPMHLTAAIGCPTLVLYAHASDPALCAQRGERVSILRRPQLDQLSVDDVVAEMTTMIGAES